jgi:hypothetical protein
MAIRGATTALIRAMCWGLALVSLAGDPCAAQQSDAYSVTRVRREVRRPAAITLNPELMAPVAVFRVTVERRQLMPTFLEQLRKEFALTDLQRQSQEWRSKCCGINLLGVLDGVRAAARDYETRRVRAQITRDLAVIEENRRREAAK